MLMELRISKVVQLNNLNTSHCSGFRSYFSSTIPPRHNESKHCLIGRVHYQLSHLPLLLQLCYMHENQIGPVPYNDLAIKEDSHLSTA